MPAAEQHCIEPNETEPLDIFDPAIRTKMRPPTRQSLIVDRLPRACTIADIVVAGHGEYANAETSHQIGRMPQVFLDIRAVYRRVAGVDAKIGALTEDPFRQWRPIVREVGFTRAEMSVGDLNYPHSASQRNAARSGIRAKTREQPTEISRTGWSPEQWPPPQKPTTGIPAAIAASTPVVLSSITIQSSGGTPSCRAAYKKRSGAGLPRATCEALKTCGSNNGNSRVTESACRTRVS